MQNQANLMALPEELIDYIALFLSIENLYALARTAKQFNNQFNDIYKAINATRDLNNQIGNILYDVTLDKVGNLNKAGKDGQTTVTSKNKSSSHAQARADKIFLSMHIIVRELPWMSMTSPLLLTVSKGDIKTLGILITSLPSEYFDTAIGQLEKWRNENQTNKFSLMMFNEVENKIAELKDTKTKSELTPKKF